MVRIDVGGGGEKGWLQWERGRRKEESYSATPWSIAAIKLESILLRVQCFPWVLKLISVVRPIAA